MQKCKIFIYKLQSSKMKIYNVEYRTYYPKINPRREQVIRRVHLNLYKVRKLINSMMLMDLKKEVN